MKVALYARVSSEKQDVDLSISAQLKALRGYALKEGYQVVREYVDEAESGRSRERPVFQEMVRAARVKPPPFQAILVWKLSRFARNREDSIIYKSLLRRQGVQEISINEPVDESPTGRMLEGIIEVLDEFYSANLAQEVTRGMREAAFRGYWVGSKVPYGYRPVKVEDGGKERVRLEPEADTSPVVKKIFQLAQWGLGVKEIAKQLNQEGIPSAKGKRWGRGQVHKVLVNEVYVGTLVWGARGRYHRESKLEAVRVERAFPAIIDPDTFRRVQGILKRRAPKVLPPRRGASPYLLSGLLKCGGCGAAMFGVGAKGGRFHYYVCATAYRSGRESCPERAVPQHLIEDQVIDKVRGLILKEEQLEELVRLTNQEVEESLGRMRERLRSLDSQVGEVERRLGRLYDALETGKVELDDLAPRIKELKEKRGLLERARAEAQEAVAAGRVEMVSREVVLEYLKELRGVLEYGSVGERRAFLRSFIQSVEKSGSQVTLRYTLPLPPEQVMVEPPGVLDTVHVGGR